MSITSRVVVAAGGYLLAGLTAFLVMGTGYQKLPESPNPMIRPFPIPESPDFCGEQLPMNDFEVTERYERELTINGFWESQTILNLKRTGRFFPIIEPILKKYKLPDDLKYVALAESGLTNVVSPAGAAGFWQFMESTGRQYGLIINDEVDERYDLEKATKAACLYLRDLKQQFGSYTAAAAAYNCGAGAMYSALSSQKTNSYYSLYLNQETSRYVFRLAALKEICEHPLKYGYDIRIDAYYQPIPVERVRVDGPVSDWVTFARQHGVNYKIVRYLNPWIRKSSLKNATKRTYWVEIPLNKSAYKPDAVLPVLTTDSILSPESFYEIEVQPGETMKDIIDREETTEALIMLWNGLTSNVLRAGQRIKIKRQHNPELE